MPHLPTYKSLYEQEPIHPHSNNNPRPQSFLDYDLEDQLVLMDIATQSQTLTSNSNSSPRNEMNPILNSSPTSNTVQALKRVPRRKSKCHVIVLFILLLILLALVIYILYPRYPTLTDIEVYIDGDIDELKTRIVFYTERDNATATATTTAAIRGSTTFMQGGTAIRGSTTFMQGGTATTSSYIPIPTQISKNTTLPVVYIEIPFMLNMTIKSPNYWDFILQNAIIKSVLISSKTGLELNNVSSTFKYPSDLIIKATSSQTFTLPIIFHFDTNNVNGYSDNVSPKIQGSSTTTAVVEKQIGNDEALLELYKHFIDFSSPSVVSPLEIKVSLTCQISAFEWLFPPIQVTPFIYKFNVNSLEKTEILQIRKVASEVFDRIVTKK